MDRLASDRKCLPARRDREPPTRLLLPSAVATLRRFEHDDSRRHVNVDLPRIHDDATDINDASCRVQHHPSERNRVVHEFDHHDGCQHHDDHQRRPDNADDGRANACANNHRAHLQDRREEALLRTTRGAPEAASAETKQHDNRSDHQKVVEVKDRT